MTDSAACASDPRRAARFMVERGYAENLDYALASLKELRFNARRSFNPEDSLRLYANRLHEVGMIKNTPQKSMAQGRDWRFLNELKKELKA